MLVYLIIFRFQESFFRSFDFQTSRKNVYTQKNIWSNRFIRRRWTNSELNFIFANLDVHIKDRYCWCRVFTEDDHKRSFLSVSVRCFWKWPRYIFLMKLPGPKWFILWPFVFLWLVYFSFYFYFYFVNAKVIPSSRAHTHCCSLDFQTNFFFLQTNQSICTMNLGNLI